MSTRYRSLLDLFTTLGILATCGVLVAANWSRLSAPAGGPVVPPEPISLEGATLRGDSSAAIVIVEWSDYQCPYCARAERDVLDPIDELFIRTKRVQLAFRHNPLAKIHPLATKAAEAALCAGEQGRFWEMHAAIFQDTKKLGERDLLRLSKSVGLDSSLFSACVAGGTAAERVRQDVKAAAELGLTGTPVFLIGKRQSDGRVKVGAILSGARPLNEFVRAIEDAEKNPKGLRANLWLLGIPLSVIIALGSWLWRRQGRLRRIPEIPVRVDTTSNLDAREGDI